MLDNVLRDIRGVGGVTGAAVIAKRSGTVKHLFPAAFTDQHIDRLLKLLRDCYQRLRGFERLELLFDRVQVILANQPEFLFFATTLPKCDLRLLDTVVKSKLPAIARALEAERAAGSPLDGVFSSDAGITTEIVNPGGPIPDNRTAIVLTMFKEFSARLAPRRGMVRLAEDWRRAKQAAQPEHQCLTALTVEPSGRLALRKGATLPEGDAGVAALAALVAELFRALGSLRGDAEQLFFEELARRESEMESTGLMTHMSILTQRTAATP